MGDCQKVMRHVVISGTGVYTPDQIITNEELVTAFNAYVDKQNAKHAKAIDELMRLFKKAHKTTMCELFSK